MTVSNSTVSILFAAILISPGCVRRIPADLGSRRILVRHSGSFRWALQRTRVFLHAGTSRGRHFTPGRSPVTFNRFDRFNFRLIVRRKSPGMTS